MLRGNDLVRGKRRGASGAAPFSGRSFGKRVKGDFAKVGGAMIFVGLIVLLLLLFSAGYVRTTATLVTAREKLDSIDTAHLVAACLEEKGVIREEFLDRAFPRLKEQCGLREGVFVAARDVEEPSRKWSSGREKEGKAHSISFALQRANGEVHVGELNVIV